MARYVLYDYGVIDNECLHNGDTRNVGKSDKGKGSMKIVTRHPALVEFLRVQGIDGDVLTHAGIEDVEGQDVIGVLPLSLACECRRFREVSMRIPPELRGQEMTLEQIRGCNPQITEYRITKI